MSLAAQGSGDTPERGPTANDLSRPGSLAAYPAVGGGLLLSLTLLQLPSIRRRDSTMRFPNCFIRIDREGRVTIILPYTKTHDLRRDSLLALVAGELRVKPDRVRLQYAPPRTALDPDAPSSRRESGSSASAGEIAATIQWVGATARRMLIAAAAAERQVDPTLCTAVDGEIVLGANSLHISYGELVDAAALLPVPQNLS